MRSHPITSDKKRAKATSHLKRIQDGQPAKVCCSAPQGYALRLLHKAHRAVKTSPTIVTPARERLPEARLRQSPDIPIEVRPQTARHRFEPKRKPPYARQRKPMRKAAE